MSETELFVFAVNSMPLSNQEIVDRLEFVGRRDETMLAKLERLLQTESIEVRFQLLTDIGAYCDQHAVHLEPAELEAVQEVFEKTKFLRYRKNLTYDANYIGPVLPNAMPPEIPLPEGDWEVFGLRIGFPFGVPSSLGTVSSEWVRLYASLGFNVLTLKTVCDQAHPVNDMPNLVFIRENQIQDGPLAEVSVTGEPEFGIEDDNSYSMANSFGLPSKDPIQWMNLIEQCQAPNILSDRQLLIVSVASSPDLRGEAQIEGFVRAASCAVEAGAKAVELNLSCPNGFTAGELGDPICWNLELSTRIVSQVRDAIPEHVKLIVKLSYLEAHLLETLIRALVVPRALVHGVSGINTLQVFVKDRGGSSTFGERPKAGISGKIIFSLGLDFVRTVAKIRSELGATFSIVGMGGITDVADVVAYFEAGADVVQSATAVLVDPQLSLRVYQELQIRQYCGRQIKFFRSQYMSDAKQLWKVSAVFSEDFIRQVLIDLHDVVSERFFEKLFQRASGCYYTNATRTELFSYSCRMFEETFGPLAEVRGQDLLVLGLDVVEAASEKGHVRIER